MTSAWLQCGDLVGEGPGRGMCSGSGAARCPRWARWEGQRGRREESRPVFRWSAERGTACAVGAQRVCVREWTPDLVCVRWRQRKSRWGSLPGGCVCRQSLSALGITQGKLPVRRFGSREGILDWNRLKRGYYSQQACSHGGVREGSLGCRLELWQHEGPQPFGVDCRASGRAQQGLAGWSPEQLFLRKTVTSDF